MKPEEIGSKWTSNGADLVNPQGRVVLSATAYQDPRCGMCKCSASRTAYPEDLECAVKCLNACLGMKDPESEIAKLRDDVVRLHRERDVAMAAAAEVARSTGETLVKLRRIEEAVNLVTTAPYLAYVDAMAVLRAAQAGEKP